MTYHYFPNLEANWTAVRSNLSAYGIFIDTTKRNVSVLEDLSTKDIYFGYTQEGQSALTTKCLATVYYVESNMTCQQLQSASLPCRVSQIRQINPAQQPSPPSLTFFDLIGESFLRSNWTFNGTTYQMPMDMSSDESVQGYDSTQYVISNFPYALPHLPDTQIQGLTAHGQMVLNLDDPTTFSNTTILYPNSAIPDLRSVDSTLVSQRLSLLLNTYFRAMLNTLVENNSGGSFLSNYIDASTDFVSPAPSTYTLDKPWIGVYLVSDTLVSDCDTQASWMIRESIQQWMGVKLVENLQRKKLWSGMLMRKANLVGLRLEKQRRVRQASGAEKKKIEHIQ